MNQPAPSDLRLLVPLDGSPQAVRALEVAQALHPTHVTILRVVTDEFLGVPGTFIEPEDGEFGPLLKDLDNEAAPLRDAGIETQTAAVFGDASQEIIEAGAASDLTVMTTRGQGAASRALFGSVADRVSRHGTSPTLLIRSQAGTVVAPRQRIVVPLDGSPRAERALEVATKLARTQHVPLHLVRVVGLDEVRETIRTAHQQEKGDAGIGETFDDARAYTEDQALAYLEAIAVPLRAEGIDVATEILQGSPSFVLLWNTRPDDLVVMTSHGRGGFRRWLLGSVAEKLVREGEAPLVLVPARDSST